MTVTAFWITYQVASHHGHQPTVQLIELDEKFIDIEDILDHVFRQGFVESKYRPFVHWERKDGGLVKPSHTVVDLLEQGVGKTPETALKLVVEDIPTCLWFHYVYLHGHTPHPTATQRIKLNEHNFDSLAHVTNYIFKEGFVAAKYRSVVHWAQPCGKRIGENVCVNVLLLEGEGTEDKPLRLIIDEIPSCHAGHHHGIGHHPEHHHTGCHCHRCTLKL